MIINFILFVALVANLVILGFALPNVGIISRIPHVGLQYGMANTEAGDVFKFRKIDRYWMVDLVTDDHKSLDISNKAFKFHYGAPLVKDSIITIELESSNADIENPTPYVNSIDHVIVESTQDGFFIPSLHFPAHQLKQGRRISIYSETLIELGNVAMVVIPPAFDLKKYRFVSKFWELNQELTKRREQDPRLILDVSTPDLFKQTYTELRGALPKKLPDNLKRLMDPSITYEALRLRYYNAKVVKVGANPNVRTITALSREITSALSDVFEITSSGGVEINTGIDQLPDDNYAKIAYNLGLFGRVISMAIANGLPLDISLPKSSIKVESGAILNWRSFFVVIEEFIPLDLLKNFDDTELDWIIYGQPDLLSTEFLRQWAKYEHHYYEYLPHIKWFWEYVAVLSKQDLCKLWEMITGSPRPAATNFTGNGYSFRIVSSIHGIINDPVDTISPVGIYSENEPALLFVPEYSSKKVLVNHFNRVIQPQNQRLLLLRLRCI